METQVDHITQGIIDLMDVYELSGKKHLEEIMRLEWILKEQNKVVEDLVNATAEVPTAEAPTAEVPTAELPAANRDERDPDGVEALFERIFALEQRYSVMTESVRSLQEVTGIPEGYCFRLPYRWEGPPPNIVRMGQIQVDDTLPLVLTSTGPAGRTSWRASGDGDNIYCEPRNRKRRTVLGAEYALGADHQIPVPNGEQNADADADLDIYVEQGKTTVLYYIISSNDSRRTHATRCNGICGRGSNSIWGRYGCGYWYFQFHTPKNRCFQLMLLADPTTEVPMAEEQMADDRKSTAEVPAAEVPAAEQPVAELRTTELPSAEVPAAEVPAAEVLAAEVPAAEILAAEVLAAEVPAAEVLTAEQPAAELRTTEQPLAEVPAAEVPAAEIPAAEVLAAEVPAAEEPTAEQPAAELRTTEQPSAEVPAAEVPAAEQPAAEQRTTELPSAEVPAAEIPAAEVLAAEVPAAPTFEEDGIDIIGLSPLKF
jgi:hypothetical protein